MSDGREFTVIISATEYKHLCNWVLKFEHLETGGDLFGLWLDKHTAVMQLVLGPGKACRRTSISFYQDVEYLGDVGSYLTHKEGLCHIGEWHSHHKLGLTRPSGGDENTVWSNMPNYGLSRFVLFIATIGRENAVNVGCFLFETDPEKRQYPVLRGNFQLLPDLSPFRSKMEIRQVIQEGAESLNTDVHLLEMKENKKDFLVSKPWRVKEKAKQKRTRPNLSAENVDKRSAEEPQSKRTPEGYRRFYNEEDSFCGEKQSRYTDKQQHPFSPDNVADTPNTQKDGCHEQTSRDDRCTREMSHHNKVEEEAIDQANIHDSSKVPAPESKNGGHSKDKRKTRGTCHASTPSVQIPPQVAENHSSAKADTVTDDPETPSGTVQIDVRDDEPEGTAASGQCSLMSCLLPWKRPKSKAK